MCVPIGACALVRLNTVLTFQEVIQHYTVQYRGPSRLDLSELAQLC